MHFVERQKGAIKWSSSPLIDSKKRITNTISSHRAVRRKAHRLLGQKMVLRHPQAYLAAGVAGTHPHALYAAGAGPRPGAAATLRRLTMKRAVLLSRFDEIGTALGNHHRRDIGIGAHHIGHDGSISHPQAGKAMH